MSRLIRKTLVLGGINCVSFSNGFLLGQMASMVHSLRTREEGLEFADWQISLIASSLMGIAVFGLGMAAVVTDKVGRRWSFIIFSVPSTLNYIILYYARTPLSFMVSRVLAGTAMGAMFALKLCVTSEYAGLKTRAVFLNMISTLMPSLGSCVAHALSIILHWRIVALMGVMPAAIGIFLPYFWVESPHWLASKGRFEECQTSFRNLHESTPSTEAELNLLLRVERTKLQKAKETNSMSTSRKLLIACKKKYFWDLMLLSIFISAFLAAAGKLAFSTLAVTIIAGMTGPENVFMFTMIVDICVISGAIASCVLIKKTSMRSMLFTTASIGIAVLVSLSACLYFKTDSVYFNWANVSLLSLYFFVVKSGPYPVLEALLGEIYPLELKVYFFFFSASILMMAMTLTVFLLPLMVGSMGYHGMFLVNAGIMGVSLGYVWIKLPETKGRTLQEIEIYFKTKNHKIDEVLNNEQMKALI